MHTLLSCDSANECQQRNCIIKVSVTEVLLLYEFLGCQVIRCCVVKFLDSRLNGNTIRECERLRFLLEEWT